MKGWPVAAWTVGRRDRRDANLRGPAPTETGLGYSFAYSFRTNRQTNSCGPFCPCPTVIPERARVLTPHTPQATCKGSGHNGLTVGQGQNKEQKKQKKLGSGPIRVTDGRRNEGGYGCHS
jgi:hypothetical protein